MKLPRWLHWLPVGHVPTIDPAHLPCVASDICQHFILIDVRTRTEWGLSHIPGAVNMPFAPLESLIPLISEANKPVLCICLSAHRSTPVVRKLRALGIESYELKGGMLKWWQHKLPTE